MSNNTIEYKANIQTRNYGIDALRIVSMLMIVMLHVIGHGGVIKA